MQPAGASWLATAVAACGLIAGGATPGQSGQQEAVRIHPGEAWSTVFGNSQQKLAYRVEAQREVAGRLTWSLGSQGRTLARGETPFRASPGHPARPELTLRVPPVKDGVILGLELVASVFAEGGRDALATHRRPIRVFPESPFADRPEWLKQLEITLFDPPGKTSSVFNRMKVPHKSAVRVPALEGIGRGLVVVGEGVSLDEHRSLPETLLGLAARGVPVVWLAPSEGGFTFPGTEGSRPPAPQRIALRGRDAIADLDKRLDADAWPPDGRVAAVHIELTGRPGRVLARVAPGDGGWPWLELRYPGQGPGHGPGHGAALVLCGFAVIERWDSSPTPRFLLARLFELAEKPAVKNEVSQSPGKQE